MGYTAFFQREARAELDAAQLCYGSEFRVESEKWLAELVAAAGAKNAPPITSINAFELLQEAADSDGNAWALSLKRFRDLPLLAKLHALITLIKKRCPPWELRAASKTFEIISSFLCEPIVIYEVDHVSKRIIFRMFDGLPGQG